MPISSSDIPVPRIISWNTTFQCNLNCHHCYLNAKEHRSREELSTPEGKKLMDQISEVSRPVLVLSGGEPLLREDIWKLASYGTEKGLRVALGTNGTLIDDAVAEKILKSGIRRVAISIDSSTPEIHDKIRGVPGAWEKAVSGVKSCIKHGIGVQFNTTVTVENCHDIPEIIKMADNLGIRDMHIFFLVPTGRGQGIKDITAEMYEALILNLLTTYNPEGMNVKPTCAPQFMRIAEQHGLDTSMWHRGCIAGINYCRIYPDGSVTPCPYLPINLGNVLETNFREIWQDNTVLQRLRNPDNLKGRCGICEYKTTCGGCRARAYGLTSDLPLCGLQKPQEMKGDYLAEDPWCPYQPQ